jgi:hypothetical protein
MEKSKKINLGISILRMWMAFEVILLHRMSWKGYEGPFFSFLKSCELFSVPVFVIAAFYFSADLLEENDKVKVKKRLIRLIVPQVGWAVLCWIVYVLTDIIFMHELSHGFLDLIIAIISGCRNNVNPSTWFQCVLIILTVLYALIYSLKDKKISRTIVYLSFFLALFIQADGRYFDFFADKPHEVMNTIGRIFEIMPYACIGMFLKHIGIYDRLNDHRLIIILTSVVLFFAGFRIPFIQFKGFFEGSYPIYMAVMLFLFFLLLPFEKVQGKGRNAILQISRFTLGIYCAHRLVYGIMDIVYELMGSDPDSFIKCLMTYLVCYAMSYIMCLLPIRVFRMMVE